MRGTLKDGIYYKLEKETGKLKMGGGAWTINLDEIANADIKVFCFVTGKARYTIDYDTAHSKGFVRTFAGENKLVVPIKFWKVEK